MAKPSCLVWLPVNLVLVCTPQDPKLYLLTSASNMFNDVVITIINDDYYAYSTHETMHVSHPFYLYLFVIHTLLSKKNHTFIVFGKD